MTDTTRSSQYSVGDTVSLDGIECLIVYAAETKQDWGRYVLVDKNHDLCWYFDGTDYQDESESHDVINNANKYGYEWGGYETSTGIAGLSIGSGLANTNSLIGMNLQPSTDGWFVLWNKVNEFRSSRSSKWFVPSMDELDLVYENRDNLSGLTTINNNSIPYSLPYYWSSSESSSTGAWVKNFDSSYFLNRSKYNHWFRTRLCRYATDADLNPSQTTPIEITCETEGADIRYTLDGSDPTEESTLYSGQFEVTPPVTIKARGYKEGMLASDVASYEVKEPFTEEIVTYELSANEMPVSLHFEKAPIESWEDCKNYNFYVKAENASGILIPETKLTDMSDNFGGMPLYTGSSNGNAMQLMVCFNVESSSPSFIYGELNFEYHGFSDSDCPLTISIRIVPKESGGGA